MPLSLAVRQRALAALHVQAYARLQKPEESEPTGGGGSLHERGSWRRDVPMFWVVGGKCVNATQLGGP